MGERLDQALLGRAAVPLKPTALVKDERWRRSVGVRVAAAAESLIRIFEDGFSLGDDWDTSVRFFSDELKIHVVYVPEQRHVAVQVFVTTNVDDRRPLSERAWSPLTQWLVPQEWLPTQPVPNVLPCDHRPPAFG